MKSISILFYPIRLEDRRDTTDDFAIIPFHLVLFLAALGEPAKSTHYERQAYKAQCCLYRGSYTSDHFI